MAGLVVEGLLEAAPEVEEGVASAWEAMTARQAATTAEDAANAAKIAANAASQAATGGPDPCPKCTQLKQQCDKLKRGIDNKAKELKDKRVPDLIDNKGPYDQATGNYGPELPWDAPGLAPRYSVSGHIDVWWSEVQALRADIEKFEDLKCPGDVSDDAYQQALRDTPYPESYNNWTPPDQ